jgi:hypothetical protein
MVCERYGYAGMVDQELSLSRTYRQAQQLQLAENGPVGDDFLQSRSLLFQEAYKRAIGKYRQRRAE